MENFYDRVTHSFSKLKKNPKLYSKRNEKLSEDIKQCMKDIYDYSVTQHDVALSSNVMPELIIENFDSEQIWQQVELRNTVLLDQSTLKISKLLAKKNDLVPKSSENSLPSPQPDEEVNEDDPADKLDILSENGLENEAENNKDSDKESHESEQLVDHDDNDEDNIDMLDREGSEEDDESETEGVGDYIFEPETGPNDKFFEEDEVYSDAEELKELEENAVMEKPWQMKGEVTCEDRPEYSLLEHNLEVDISRKPPPVITEGTTLNLEEIIKQRIKDRAFDSVERKTKPVETPLEYKKKLVLDQEKSKLSLAQIYENQYLNQAQSLDPDHEKQEEEPDLHKEIRKMMSQLFSKLDALSNYHFTPKPSVPELKVISNLPAVLMEEVIPVTTSDATLLAPEEVRGKAKGDILGKSERSSSDKKRERRKKKLKQKIHAKEHQKNKSTVLSGANIKKMKENPKAKKLKKGAEEVKATDNKVIRSSTAFFDQLEDEIQTQKQNRSKSKRKNEEKFNPKRMKL